MRHVHVLLRMLHGMLTPPPCCADDVEVTGVVIRRFGLMAPGARCQIGLALQATCLAVANERKAALEVAPEAVQAFTQFWDAHAACPLLGRNKVGGSNAWPHLVVAEA